MGSIDACKIIECVNLSSATQKNTKVFGIIILLSLGLLFSGMASYLLWTNINQSIIDTEHKTGSGSTDNTVITSTEEDYHEHNTGYFDTEPVEQTKDDNSAQISPDGDSTSINDGDSSTNTNTSDEDSDGTGEAEVDDRIEDLLILIKTPVDEIICLHEESSELPMIDNPNFDTCVDMSLDHDA